MAKAIAESGEEVDHTVVFETRALETKRAPTTMAVQARSVKH
jgi:hypothetical protein